jgi:hypothetical protein
MANWSLNGGGHANIEQYSIPTYIAAATDPLRRIYDRQRTADPGVLRDTIRVPDEAQPARGTDGHLNVIDETHRWVVELYAVRRLPSGDLTTKGFNRNDLRGPGAGFSAWMGSVASGTSSLGGMIRKGELVNGTAGFGTGIRHALQAVVPPAALSWNAPGRRPFVWPASSADTPAFQRRGYEATGNVYMGSLLAIPSSVNLDGLGIADPQAREVARALQDYGIYIVDTGRIRLDQIVIRIDPQAAHDIRDQRRFAAGLKLALGYLQVVTNSHAGGFQPSVPGGGGILRRPLPPTFIEPRR